MSLSTYRSVVTWAFSLHLYLAIHINQLMGNEIDTFSITLTKPFELTDEQAEAFISNHIPITKDAPFSESIDDSDEDSNSSDNKKYLSGCFCGQSAQNRIIGGTETSINEFPWMAYLIIRRNTSTFLCGGFLVTDRHVITAAHCTMGAEPSGIVVVLGDHNRTNPNEVRSVRVEVIKINMHPNYNQPTRHNNDISVLTLKHCLEFSRRIQPVCLPYVKMDYSDKTAIATGWGTISQGGRTSDVLRSAELPIISHKVCMENYGKSGVKLTKRMICAGRCGKDSCQGDSGGPLQILMGGRYYAIGIVSFGIGCGIEEYPGVFTRVDKQLRFIESIIRGGRMCI